MNTRLTLALSLLPLVVAAVIAVWIVAFVPTDAGSVQVPADADLSEVFTDELIVKPSAPVVREGDLDDLLGAR